MGYFRNPKWREINREILRRYKYGEPIYKVISPPDNSSDRFGPNRLTISTSTAYKVVNRFKEFGILDTEGRITPLGLRVQKLVADIENFDPANYDEETLKVSADTGLIERVIRHEYHPESTFAPSWLPYWLPPVQKLSTWLSYRSVPRRYAYVSGDRIHTLNKKYDRKILIISAKAWFRYYVLRDRQRRGNGFVLRKVGNREAAGNSRKLRC